MIGRRLPTKNFLSRNKTSYEVLVEFKLKKENKQIIFRLIFFRFLYHLYEQSFELYYFLNGNKDE
jgi:hypothetical protein